MHGKLKYGADFTHFSYVNPDAPKGGKIVFSETGGFDSLNPLIVKGVPAAKLRGFVFESLMARSFDEPFSLYGLLAVSIDTPDERNWVAFTLHDKAKFSDGSPVTVNDIIFSWKTLRDSGRPNHRFYYSKVESAKIIKPRTIKFIFKSGSDRELPLIMGLMPILPQYRYDNGAFEKADLKTPLGSGPYRVVAVKPGSGIHYERNPDYWGADLAVNRGRYNFDKVSFDYYRDANSRFEAFKKGLYDVRLEHDPGRWSQSYNFPAFRDGRIVRDKLAIGKPSGMHAFVFNTRRSIFKDIRVRKALTALFDFEWGNAHLFHSLYTRTESYFDRSALSSNGIAASDYEKKLLSPFPDAVLPEIMNGIFHLPKSSGKGRNRKNRHLAVKLLEEAGYRIKNGKMTNSKTGEPFEFEIMVTTKSAERLSLNYSKSLKRIGITARIRHVDSAQYQRRRQVYDYDMIQDIWYSSLSPGNEQTFRWGSKVADMDGSFNFAGVKSKAADTMIDAMLAARSRENFTDSVRALDRVLLSGYYVIPLFHKKRQWIAWWRRVARPGTVSLYGYRPDTWWFAGEAK